MKVSYARGVLVVAEWKSAAFFTNFMFSFDGELSSFIQDLLQNKFIHDVNMEKALLVLKTWNSEC